MTFARRSHGLIPMSSLPSRRGRRPSRARRPSLGPERCEERMLLSIALVSSNAAGTGPGNSMSDFSSVTYGGPPGGGPTDSPQANLSADGTKLVFVSEATNLVGSLKDTNHGSDVFVRGMSTGQTSLVSATPSGQTGNGDSYSPAISPDGRYVAFLSQATNLSSVAAPSIGSPDPSSGYLYVRDLQMGTTTLLDQTPDGQASDGWSTGQVVFSPDSKSLAFIDTSDNLTSALVDPSSGSTSVPGWGGPSFQPSYVYVRDLARQSTSLASVSTDGQASGSTSIDGPSATTDLVFSPDSRSLVFGSTAIDLTANPPDSSPNPYPGTPFGSQNLFFRDLSAGITTLISVTNDGSLAASDCYGATFSPDGHSLVFTSAATNLTTNASDAPSSAGSSNPYGPNGPSANLFLRDLTTGTTTLVSATPGGLLSNGTSDTPLYSPDGQSLAFLSTATDLTNASGDSSPMPGTPSTTGSSPAPSPADNVFIEDLTTGKIAAISTTPSGELSTGAVNELEYSPDGRYLAFVSNATDLTKNAAEPAPPPAPIPGAPAGATVPISPSMIDNVFVRHLTEGTTTLASATTGGLLSNATSGGLYFSPDSRVLFFASNANDLTSNPPDTSSAPPWASNTLPNNLFATDLSTGTTTLISATAAGRLSAASGTTAFLSPDGNTLYFDSDAIGMTAGGTGGSTNIYAASAPFTTPGQIHFLSYELAANESDGRAVVTVVRDSPATTSASVDYTVLGGTARAGTDFTATTGTLSFAAGETLKTITVPLVAGDSYTGTRSAQLVLSNPQGAGLGYPSATLDLTSSPAPPAATPNTPTSTPATPSHTVATPPAVADPGPTVLGVTALKGRRGTTTLLISFNRALDPATAQNAANYQVSLPRPAPHRFHGHRSSARPGRSVDISAATYDPSQHQVTLTLRSKWREGRAAQLQIKGTSGGLASPDGVPLNSPNKQKPGQDYLATLDLVTHRA
jgi:hypothetical protein